MLVQVTTALDNVDQIIEQAIQSKVFPGATIWVGYRGKTVKCSAYGRTSDGSCHTYNPVPVTTKTLYDLASLTKVIVTTWAIMHLMEQGYLGLADAVSQYLPVFGRDPQKASVTVGQILSHSSGLPAPLKLYRKFQGKDEIIEGICQQKLVFSPGTQHLYCDLGFILLGEVVRVVSSLELDEYARRYLFIPLGMKDTMFNPPQSIWDRVAPTEYAEWRGGLVRGLVHDENAWAMGGVAGHAGLFSTVEDLAKFCNTLLGWNTCLGNRVFKVSNIVEMVSRRSPSSEFSYCLGWMINHPSFMGALANRGTFGHTGFTGTSILINPQQGLAAVFLSNRVCPTRNGPNLNPYRQKIANALVNLCTLPNFSRDSVRHRTNDGTTLSDHLNKRPDLTFRSLGNGYFEY